MPSELSLITFQSQLPHVFHLLVHTFTLSLSPILNPISMSQNVPLEIWDLIALEYVDSDDRRDPLSASSNHNALLQAVGEILLKRLSTGNTTLRGGKINKLSVKHSRDFIWMSICSRILRNEHVRTLKVCLSEAAVDDEQLFLSLILKELKKNGTKLEELRLQYQEAPPFTSRPSVLLKSIKDLDISTVLVKARLCRNLKLVNMSDKKAFHVSDCASSGSATNALFDVVREHVTHIILSRDSAPALLSAGGLPWTHRHYPSLEYLSLDIDSAYLRHILIFLSRNQLSSLDISRSTRTDELHLLWRNGENTIADLQFLPPPFPDTLYCPPKLHMPDVWACLLLRQFVEIPDLEDLTVIPTSLHHTQEEMSCLDYVGNVGALSVISRISVDGRFYQFCPEKVEYRSIDCLKIWCPQQEDTLETPRAHISAEDLEVLPRLTPVLDYPTHKDIFLQNYIVSMIQHFPCIRRLFLILFDDVALREQRIPDMNFTRIVRRLGWTEGENGNHMIDVVIGLTGTARTYRTT
jgi:hypothetical protein